jgi:hypothetical protein
MEKLKFALCSDNQGNIKYLSINSPVIQVIQIFQGGSFHPYTGGTIVTYYGGHQECIFDKTEDFLTKINAEIVK